jgi:long-subunit acyl-CoA synthetase (AMP-forming)
MYDFVFKKIRQGLGGECKFILTGSAPISPEVLHFMRVVAGCFVIEGYGATETGGACSVQIPGEISSGNIGPPFLCSMYKLADHFVSKVYNKGSIQSVISFSILILKENKNKIFFLCF